MVFYIQVMTGEKQLYDKDISISFDNAVYDI
jgi:hypothetical protein